MLFITAQVGGEFVMTYEHKIKQLLYNRLAFWFPVTLTLHQLQRQLLTIISEVKG